MRRIRELSTFFGEFRSNFSATGAILPSSRFLARSITQACQEAPRNARFLEAGPGTGAFTDALIRSLRPGDHLVLCELNDRFVEVLRYRLESDPAWHAKQSQIELKHGAVEQLDPEERFDAIVCGLPFNNFPPALVDQLFRQFLEHLRLGGTFSFFEYAAIRTLKAPFVSGEEKQRLNAIANTIGGYLRSNECRDSLVWLNVPPAVVHCLKKTR